ncbi:dethiobiotin synthase [Parvibaculum sp.]|jgi:dethiobiotin synthetase|uniref:dethiobiotin synthase n=1 Tax=Parvibaculum sp. TaxID=2024848 RepID=UPI001B0FEB54|nr:dethiobiotin synthase [Parvibaculum sp.]MBO6635763.1 dethiobiotin synthase [Parvibaculum sp.]MBO6677638.1 dethiobiotin synthase [Parvibaculum sp.]MBO6684478.1 dethiobiotin synthase [Parvibaculum sp.]MBO6905602.1 dethiobiotin synthase [Parvibaculum sp.]
MPPIFVTSSGTEIGKTYVSAMLTRELKARAIKPLVSGIDEETFPESDPAQLLAAMGEPVTFANAGLVSRWRFKAALSPDMAAKREGRSIDFDELVEECVSAAAKHDPLVIEGVGGLMVPLDGTHTVLDWMKALDAKTGVAPLLVVGAYLGTISHTLTTLAVMRAEGIPPRAIVVSEAAPGPVPVEETAETIARFAGRVPVRALPRGGTLPLAGLF